MPYKPSAEKPKMTKAKSLMAAIAACLLLNAGCDSHANGHRCIGAFDDPEAGVKYEVSGWNVFLGIVFFETIFVPAIVVLTEIRCPLPKADP